MSTENNQKFLRIESEQRINAPPEKVFEALTTGLDKWWPFRARPDAQIVYEPRASGYIFED